MKEADQNGQKKATHMKIKTKRDKNQSKTKNKILISSERKEKKFQLWNKERLLERRPVNKKEFFFTESFFSKQKRILINYGKKNENLSGKIRR